jgi:antitoxin YefM
MKTLSLSEVKMKLSQLVESVKETDQEIVITRNGRPVAVLVSVNEFEGWKETLSIQSNDQLMREIEKGLVSLKEKGTCLYTLEELFDQAATSRT